MSIKNQDKMTTIVKKLKLNFKDDESSTKKYEKYICPLKLQSTYDKKMKEMAEEKEEESHRKILSQLPKVFHYTSAKLQTGLMYKTNYGNGAAPRDILTVNYLDKP